MPTAPPPHLHPDRPDTPLESTLIRTGYRPRGCPAAVRWLRARTTVARLPAARALRAGRARRVGGRLPAGRGGRRPGSRGAHGAEPGGPVRARGPRLAV